MTDTTIHYSQVSPTVEYASITLDATEQAMSGLKIAGKRPSIKLAFWSACLSTRNRLDNNCRQASIMRQYVDRPLPVNRDELKSQLGALLSRTLNSLYEIEALFNAGIIHFNCGSTFESQSHWRDSMVAAIPGMGMKTVSFALHIYSPDTCKLLTIDCWHLRRIGVTDTTIRRGEYLRYEQEIREDCKLLGECEGQGKQYSDIVLAACLWERTRHHYNASQGTGGYQDHSGLSCYV